MLADRKQIAAAVRDAADKAGALVGVALGIAAAALLLAAAAFLMVLKVRRA